MKRLAVALLLVAVVAFAQNPRDANETVLLKNARVIVTQAEIRDSAPIQHDHDTLTVLVGRGPVHKGSSDASEVFFSQAGSSGPTGPTLNNGTGPLRAVIVAFVAPQGRVQPEKPRSSRYCNPGSKIACVNEKYLFCTEKACVEEVTMGVGAVTTKHSHDTDHMIVALTDYTLADDIVGKGVKMRTVPPGGVEYIPAGITHTLTNKTGKETRFVVVVFK